MSIACSHGSFGLGRIYAPVIVTQPCRVIAAKAFSYAAIMSEQDDVQNLLYRQVRFPFNILTGDMIFGLWSDEEERSRWFNAEQVLRDGDHASSWDSIIFSCPEEDFITFCSNCIFGDESGQYPNTTLTGSRIVRCDARGSDVARFRIDGFIQASGNDQQVYSGMSSPNVILPESPMSVLRPSLVPDHDDRA